MKKIKGLDALRAIAVLLVIRAHWGPNGFNNYPYLTIVVQKIIPSGSFAVDFFFVLSGFLITNILLKSKNNELASHKFSILKVFIIRRCLRIFPVYYICLLCLFIINYPDIRHYIVYYATYTSNYLSFFQSSWNRFSHTWTLSVEEQFYLIWPFVIIFSPDRFLLKVIIAFIVGGTLMTALTQYMYGPFSDVLTFNCFNAFAIGGLYSYAVVEKKTYPKVKKLLVLLLPVALILYIAMLFNIETLPIRLVNAIISINIIIYVVEERYGRVAAVIIDSKFLNSLGRISYGIYLFHYAIPYLYYDFLNLFGINSKSKSHLKLFLYTPAIAELLHFISLILISYLSFYVIEKNILKLKSHFEYKNISKVN